MGHLVLEHDDDRGVFERVRSSGITLGHHEDDGVGVRRLGMEEDVGLMAQ